jgi:hypothetical protein
MEKVLFSKNEVKEMINSGKRLVLAGDETMLNQLPKGEWIGGTIPYFMGDDGGVFTKEKIYVNDVSDLGINWKFSRYNEKNIHKVTTEAFDNGFSYIILPALQPVHITFGLNAPGFENAFINPLMGWVSGVAFEEFGKKSPKVYLRGEELTKEGVVMHVELPDHQIGRLEIVNLYEPGNGDEITFFEDGFDTNRCMVNGKERNLYEYFVENNISERLPIVANYFGAKINVGHIWDKENKKVNAFAPVFKDQKYYVAKGVTDYSEEFKKELNLVDTDKIKFSCNCLMNYFNFGLENTKIGSVHGPFTFGEIGYQLLNQTFVYLMIENA